MKITVNEIFGPTIQGEGTFVGTPSIFMRLNGCNLRCAFAGGSICDTAYTSHNAEKVEPRKVEDVVNELVDLFMANPNVHHLVITGGEPMLQQEALADVLFELDDKVDDLVYTIETNGSIAPTAQKLDEVDRLFFSVSPKLENSCCFEGTNVPEKQREMHIKNRINYKAVASMADRFPGQLKFVFSADGKSEGYIKDYLNGLAGELGVNADATINEFWPVMIMPEGQTEEQITTSAKACVDAAVRNGWTVADRLHIRIWNDKRGV